MNGKHLLASWEGKKEKTRQREKKKKKIRVCVELSPFMLSNTVYQRIELY